MNILNTNSILTELTAIRIGLQYLANQMMVGAPNFYQLAQAGLKDEFYAGYGKQIPREPYQPSDIITPRSPEEEYEREELAEMGDDTSDMLEMKIRAEFAHQHGVVALQCYDANTEPAVGLYNGFKTLYLINMSKTGGIQ